MTDLERARKASELVNIMVQAFRELSDEYWYDQMCPMDSTQLGIELSRAEKRAFQDLRRCEQYELNRNLKTGKVDNA